MELKKNSTMNVHDRSWIIPEVKKRRKTFCLYLFCLTFVLQKSPTRYSGLFLMHENKGLLCIKRNSRNQEQILSLSHVVIFLHIAETEHFLRTLCMNDELKAPSHMSAVSAFHMSQECTRLTKGQPLDK